MITVWNGTIYCQLAYGPGLGSGIARQDLSHVGSIVVINGQVSVASQQLT
jgi:hypothetical protein